MVDEAETFMPQTITFLARSTNWVFGAAPTGNRALKYASERPHTPTNQGLLTGTKSDRGRSPSLSPIF